jgi:hypothetical protein
LASLISGQGFGARVQNEREMLYNIVTNGKPRYQKTRTDQIELIQIFFDALRKE